MVSVTIRETGMAAMRAHLAGVVAAGKAVSGPIISLSSSLPYAGPVERGRTASGRWVRRAGPARMFELGIAAVRPQIGPALLKAIPGGAAAVQAAKRSLNQRAVEEVQKRTPVRSGALRASVRPSERPA
jgi:hypothetical protein